MLSLAPSASLIWNGVAMTKKRVLFQREQFKLLCEAKRLIAKEFDQNLALHADNLVEQLSVFAKVSSQSRLTSIHEKVALGQIMIKSSSQPKQQAQAQTASIKPQDKIKVGDIIDGKVCSGFYRGRPVFN